MPRPLPRTFRVKSFGCQMNVYDGERMGELLTAEGMTPAAEGEQAELTVLNTCHIRDKATEKVYSDIGRLAKEGRRSGVRPMIAVAGCVAQAEGAEVAARSKDVDVVVGPQAYHHLPALLAKAAKGEAALDTSLPALAKFGRLPPRGLSRRTSAFLTVQEGCDKFCTYCVVPYTRGSEVSRSWSAVLDEARALLDAGAIEITLLGQNVNAWVGTDEAGRAQGLDGLIRALDRMGVRRIRYTTSHPNDMTAALIAAHGEVPGLMPYLHLPVQSGCDRVLKAMNRSHTAASYLRVLDRVRAARPDIALSGDFIVGFPGETEAEFGDTLTLVREVGYAAAYSFKYSARPGTPAAVLPGAVPDEVMDERLQGLQAALAESATAFNAGCVGRRCEVLLDRPGRREGQRIGKTPWLQSVHLQTDAPLGSLVEVELVSAGPNSLGGVAV